VRGPDEAGRVDDDHRAPPGGMGSDDVRERGPAAPAREREPARPADTLGLAPEEVRELGYWIVDHVVEHFETIAAKPPIATGTPADLRSALGGPPPLRGGEPLEALQTAADVALTHMQHGDHPRNFARVPGPSSFAGVLGDWLATGCNAMAASWTGGSGPATLELVALDWLRSLLGLPEGTEGVMLSGGSMANMTALAAARASLGPGVCYLSDETHASIVRGLAALGFAPEDVHIIPSDDEQRLPLAAFANAIERDRAAGRNPIAVVANAGTTNTGAVDPLPQIAELCRREGLWFHIDGAYGAPAALCEAGGRALQGIELADSLALDPHKWLFQPYDLACLLVRRRGALEHAFRMSPDYLADVTGAGEEVDLRDRTLELTRRARGLKLWLTFRIHGTERIGEAVAHGIHLAEHAERLLAEDDDWQVVTGAQLGIVTFALRGAGHEELKRRADALARDGHAHLTTTWVRDQPVLRLCTINPRTTEDDIAATLRRLGVKCGGGSFPEAR
jgi:aromatic-L-amino-acid/L-tryptophan decarboxylase